MKRSIATLALIVFSVLLMVSFAAAAAGQDLRLIDMYARKEADAYVVHIMADGDISEFVTTQDKRPDGSYKLTLDVPALAPTDSKYDVETPFSQRFQVWPMQLRKKFYSRIAIDLSGDSSAVVGVENPGHVFIRIQSKSGLTPPTANRTPAVAQNRRPPTSPEIENDPRVANTIVGVLPVEPTAYNNSQSPNPGKNTNPNPAPPSRVAQEPDAIAPEPVADLQRDASGSFQYNETEAEGVSGEDDAFFSLFPAGAQARPEQSLFTPETSLFEQQEDASGIRVGRFAIEPRLEVNYLGGDNLLLAQNLSIVESGLLVRGSAVARLMDSDHDLSVSYAGNYRKFSNFELIEPITHFVDFQSTFYLSPKTQLRISDRVVRGAFESAEIDPGRELFVSFQPFFRNFLTGAFQIDVSERMGFEVTGAQNHVEFIGDETEFFGYDNTAVGGNFLYHLSPTKSMFVGYTRSMVPGSISRPEAESNGDQVNVGLRGELSATMTGQVSVGYSQQNFIVTGEQFRGLVARAGISRFFGEHTALFLNGGRQANLSNFEQNNYYVSNYGNAQFVMPLRRHLQLRARGSLYDNKYPIESASIGNVRRDRSYLASIGVVYYPTGFLSIGVDYWHDRRTSNVAEFEYRNNVLQLGFGLGYLR